VTLPYYFNHDMWLEVEGVERKYLQPGPDMVPTIAAATELIDERTRGLVLVSPGNPSGVTLSSELLGEFYDLCAERGIALVLDETYRSYRFSNAPAHDLYSRPHWDQHLITLHSFSKDLAIPGYRVGAAVGSPQALAEAMKLVDCVAICAPRIGQEAALAGVLHAGDWRIEQAERIGKRHDQFRAAMADAPGGYELVSSGAYFGWVRHPHQDTPTLQVVADLLASKDILVIPGTAFTPTDEHMLRFSFANLIGRHGCEVEEWGFVAVGHGIFDLVVEAFAGLGRKGDSHLFVAVTSQRPLAVLREARFGCVAFFIATGEHLLEHAEAVVAHKNFASRGSAVGLQVGHELVQIVGVIGYVLARMVTVSLDELGHL